MKQTLNSIQVLRGIAALVVVIHHCIRAATVLAKGMYGPSLLDIPWFYTSLGAGVDIFFVISGFIMVLMSGPYTRGDRPVRAFISKRIARIYPPYLVATALLLASFVLQYGLTADFNARRLLGALTLWPTTNESGSVAPILGVGWTLSYEMYFYGVFATAIYCFGKQFLWPLCFALPIVCVIATLIDANSPTITFLRNSIVVEFLFGCLIGAAFVAKRLPRLRMSSCALGTALIFAATFALGEPAISRALVWGLPAALIVATVAGCTWSPRSAFGRFAVFLGDASFSIYLVHTIVIYRVLGKSFRILHRSIDWSIAIDVLIAVATGIAFFFVVERPLKGLSRVERR